MKAESVMYALIQNAAEFFITFEDQYVLDSVSSRGDGRRKTCRSAADDHNIIIHHKLPPLFPLVSPEQYCCVRRTS